MESHEEAVVYNEVISDIAVRIGNSAEFKVQMFPTSGIKFFDYSNGDWYHREELSHCWLGISDINGGGPYMMMLHKAFQYDVPCKFHDLRTFSQNLY